MAENFIMEPTLRLNQCNYAGYLGGSSPQPGDKEMTVFHLEGGFLLPLT